MRAGVAGAWLAAALLLGEGCAPTERAGAVIELSELSTGTHLSVPENGVLRAHNGGSSAVRWVLELPSDALARYAVEEHTTGSPVRVHDPSAASLGRGNALLIETPPHADSELHVAGRGPLGRVSSALALREHSYFDASLRGALRTFAFYGVLAVLCAFNLGAYALIRQREFLSYALFLACEVCAHAAVAGDVRWLLQVDMSLAERAVPSSVALCLVALAAFTRDLLARYDQRGDLTRLCRVASWASTGLLAFSLLAETADGVWLMSRVLLGLLLCTPLILRAVARREDRELWLYNRSWYSVMLLLPIETLRYVDLLPTHAVFEWVGQLGCAVQAVLTSLALAWRVNLMRAQVGELNTQLRRRVAELKVALFRAEAATARAERATKVKDEFIATMSHELRTPLNAVINAPRGLMGELREVRVSSCTRCDARYVLDDDEPLDAVACTSCAGPLTQPARELRYRGRPERTLRFLRSIERCGLHLLQMVNGILDISTMDAGTLSIQRADTSLYALIGEAVEEVSGTATGRAITIHTELPDDARGAHVDPVRVKQVLHNLLANALKFSGEGSSVTVRWRQEPRGDTVSVEDRGIGIAPEHTERIFRRFEQVHVGDTRRYGGTGLGLSIARSLVRMHGGELWVHSELGRGSVFSFHLPHAPSAPSASLASEPGVARLVQGTDRAAS